MTDEAKTLPNTPRAAMDVVEEAAGCGDHPCEVPFKLEDIEKVYSADYGCCCGSALEGKTCNSYCDTSGDAMFRLKDGRYVLASVWADTSGHG